MDNAKALVEVLEAAEDAREECDGEVHPPWCWPSDEHPQGVCERSLPRGESVET